MGNEQQKRVEDYRIIREFPLGKYRIDHTTFVDYRTLHGIIEIHFTPSFNKLQMAGYYIVAGQKKEFVIGLFDIQYSNFYQRYKLTDQKNSWYFRSAGEGVMLCEDRDELMLCRLIKNEVMV